jgi:hypothetical protein
MELPGHARVAQDAVGGILALVGDGRKGFLLSREGLMAYLDLGMSDGNQ